MNSNNITTIPFVKCFVFIQFIFLLLVRMILFLHLNKASLFSILHQVLFLLVSKADENDGQGAGDEQQHERPVPPE